jgi:membrane-associated phospholipid phosphatase
MHGLESLDISIFRFINQGLVNPVFDVVMPFVSGNRFFHPALVILGIFLICKWRLRGLLFVLMLAAVVGIGDGLITNTLKHAVGRDRPFLTLPDVRLLVGKAGSGSMPSGHAANWFSATMVALIYFRRSIWFMLPLAVLVSFSRIYNGVHYPSDVIAGAILGAGYAAALLWLFNSIWNLAGLKWFPLWWQRVPSLVAPPAQTGVGAEDAEEEPPLVLPARKGMAPAGFRPPHVSLDAHWLRLGYLCIAVLLIVRWCYIAGNTIQLAEDEAYQWVWSKHLDLAYFSKPPLIAYTQFLGTTLWGDRAFGVRFFSPLITALLSVLVLRFFAREVNARAGFFLLLIVTTAPLLAAGAVLMTVDPLSVLFWTAATLAGWRAIQDQSTTRTWLWVGLWMGLGLLSKFTALFQLLCWVVLFALWPPARKHLRRPGPYLALAINLLCALPVVIWNYEHHWSTLSHLADNADAHKPWTPTLRFVGDFIAGEAALLNPVYFVAAAWASVAFWRRNRHNPLLIYFFSMGAPVFLAYLLHSFKSRILLNWIVPAVVPLFCLMVIYWDTRLRLGVVAVKKWLGTGLILGATVVVLFHNTNLVGKLTGYELPTRLDPLHRVREWDNTARAVDTARQELAREGKPVFIITDHYGLTGQFSFYLPEARTNVVSDPLVFFRSSHHPENQFYFWPGYERRKGQSAIFVRELNRDNPTPEPPPARLVNEFESVTDLGVTNVLYRGRYLLRPLQLFACRGLK